MEIQTIKATESLNIKRLKKGAFHHLQIHINTNSLGIPWKVPVMVAKGEEPGPVVGITAALHGNELNGLPTIYKLFDNIKLNKLKGALIAVPIMNVPGYLAKQREFNDKTDLNRIIPGQVKGTSSQMYVWQLTHKIVKQFDYLLDLHTASFGRVNSLYIRADLDNDICLKMAKLQNPEIIVSKYDEQGTLRAWANSAGIPAITIEIGNPHRIQKELVDSTYDGIVNLLKHLGMLPGKPKTFKEEAVICDSSYWVYSDTGGIVEVFPELTEMVEKDQVIARVKTIYGKVTSKIVAPERGIVIGKNVDPVCESGSRLLHLGIVAHD